MKLFIAEKPSVAADIAKALPGSFTKQDECYVSGENYVTWCYGHLLKTCDPEIYNPAYKNWSRDVLPLRLFPLQYEPIADKKTHTKKVIALLKKCDEIILATDADDEGELLGREIIEFAGVKKPIRRALINDNTDAGVKKALADLKPGEQFEGSYRKALARSAGDLIYGLSMTRLCTILAREKGHKSVLSVGRVQTPVLGLIVRRFLANQSHSSSYYYTLQGAFQSSGTTFNASWKPGEDAPLDEKKRLTDKTFAEALKNALTGKSGTVTVADTADKETPPPLPFDLARLQQQMNKTHKLTTARTLEVTQQLREKFKAITYNRSDCSYLSDEQFQEAPAILDALKNLSAFSAVETDSSRKSKAFDSSKITAHTAIIPTLQIPDMNQLDEDQKAVYLAIARQFVAQFVGNKRYQEATATLVIENQTFSTSARKITAEGFTAILGSAASSDDDDSSDDEETGSAAFAALSQLKAGETVDCDTVTVSEKKTSPPALFTESTLLTAMIRIADYVTDPHIKNLLKEKDKDKDTKRGQGGIGTPATRSAIIETLKKRNFVTVEKNKLIPTQTGIDFINSLPESTTMPDMTALWSEKQNDIENNTLSVEDFIAALYDEFTALSATVKLDGIKAQPQQVQGQADRLSSPCPGCGAEIVIRPKLYICTECDFKIWSVVAEKKITPAQAEKLIKKGKTDVIKGFAKKDGTTFDAVLTLADKKSGKVTFEWSKK